MENTTEHDIILKNRTVLGKLQLVKSVTPLEVRKKADNGGSVEGVFLPDETSKSEEHVRRMLGESPELVVQFQKLIWET